MRELDYQCENVGCGHTFVVQAAVVRTIVPSATPRAGVHLPRGNPNLGPKRMPKPANDDTRHPANDETLPAASAPDPMSG
ncbi:ogr/Delta-like zinc finger family protein [Sphingomonas panni]